LPPYRALARELNFCNEAGCGCGSLAQAINGLALAEKRLLEGKTVSYGQHAALPVYFAQMAAF
jgi:hypothetical protein